MLSRYTSPKEIYCGAHDSPEKRQRARQVPAPIAQKPKGPVLLGALQKAREHCEGCGRGKQLPGRYCSQCAQQPKKRTMEVDPPPKPEKAKKFKNPVCKTCGGATRRISHLGYLRCAQQRGPCGCFVAPVSSNGKVLKPSWEGTKYSMDGTPLKPNVPHNWRITAYVRPKKGAGARAPEGNSLRNARPLHD